MNTHTRRRDTPQGHRNFAGERRGVPTRKVDAVNHPFPNKPVSHRRQCRPQVSLDLDDFENITVSTQPIAPLLPQEHHSDGITETTVPSLSDRLPSEELQMANAIHAKQLMLQEKLWQVKEKLQLRELARGRDRVMRDRRHDDFKRVRHKQAQRTEERMRTTKEEQQDDSETIQPNRKGNKGTYKVISSKQEVNGELNQSRWHRAQITTCYHQGFKEKEQSTKLPGKSKQSASGSSPSWHLAAKTGEVIYPRQRARDL